MAIRIVPKCLAHNKVCVQLMLAARLLLFLEGSELLGPSLLQQKSCGPQARGTPVSPRGG